MKKVFLILIVLVTTLACKNEEKTPMENTQDYNNLPEGVEVYRGEFIYLADAAVLTTTSEIYGVEIDENMHKLAEQAKPFQTNENDFVQVVITATKQAKGADQEGWPYKLTIQEIIHVSKADNSGTAILQSEEKTQE